MIFPLRILGIKFETLVAKEQHRFSLLPYYLILVQRLHRLAY